MTLAVIFCGATALAGAQQAAGERADAQPLRDTDYTLSFGKAFVQPGNEANLSVLFGRKSSAANIRKLRARFRFPAKVISYLRIEDAYLSRRAKLQMKAEETSGADGENTLELTFEMPDAAGSFPSGQIATVFFKTASPAADQVIRINPEAWIDEQPILPESPQAQIEMGLVKITQEPVIVGCFFFTH